MRIASGQSNFCGFAKEQLYQRQNIANLYNIGDVTRAIAKRYRDSHKDYYSFFANADREPDRVFCK